MRGTTTVVAFAALALLGWSGVVAAQADGGDRRACLDLCRDVLSFCVDEAKDVARDCGDACDEARARLREDCRFGRGFDRGACFRAASELRSCVVPCNFALHAAVSECRLQAFACVRSCVRGPSAPEPTPTPVLQLN